MKSPTTETRRAFGAQTAKFGALVDDDLRAEPLVELAMIARDEQIVVHRPEEGDKGVRVGDAPGARPAFGREPVGRARVERRQPLEESGVVNAVERGDLGRFGDESGRAGDEGANHEARRRLVEAEQGEGVAMTGGDDRVDFVRVRPPVR